MSWAEYFGKTSRELKDWEICYLYPDGHMVIDEMDPIDGRPGITAIGFFYKSKATGSDVIIHPSSVAHLTYKLPEREQTNYGGANRTGK